MNSTPELFPTTGIPLSHNLDRPSGCSRCAWASAPCRWIPSDRCHWDVSPTAFPWCRALSRVMPENSGWTPVVPIAQPGSLGESEWLQGLGDNPAVCCSAVI